jgi:hypothetical protein
VLDGEIGSPELGVGRRRGGQPEHGRAGDGAEEGHQGRAHVAPHLMPANRRRKPGAEWR